MRLVPLFAVALVGCASTAMSDWMAKMDAVENAEMVIDYEVVSSRPLTPDERKDRERVLFPRLERCARPIVARLGEKYDAARPMMLVNPAAAYVPIGPDARQADADLARCFANEGAKGSLYMRYQGQLLTNVEYNALMVRTASEMPAGASYSSGGCGSRGGPGYRKANGRCASWRD